MLQYKRGDLMFYRYCPVCGMVSNTENDNCEYCKGEMIETNIVYKFTEWATKKNKIELDIFWGYDVENNSQFNKRFYQKRLKGEPPLTKVDELEKRKQKEEDEYRERMLRFHSSDTTSTFTTTTPNVPKCPTCGSTDIKKISLGSKAVGFAAVGVFSSNFGKTMVCNNCGYKW